MRARVKQLSRIGQIFADGRRIDEALRMAAREPSAKAGAKTVQGRTRAARRAR